MGVQLAAEQTGLANIGDVNFSDLELAYHVRDALKSVSLVSILLKIVFLTRIEIHD